MKTIVLFSGLATLVALSISCDRANSRYVDLRTGDHIELKKDPQTDLMVDAETNKPVRIYVDTKTKDTIYGKTGKVINGSVVKRDGEYVYDEKTNMRHDADYSAESGEYKIKRGDYKKKVEKDGDIKIKDGDTKIKIDGETGERKVKHDD